MLTETESVTDVLEGGYRQRLEWIGVKDEMSEAGVYDVEWRRDGMQLLFKEHSFVKWARIEISKHSINKYLLLNSQFISLNHGWGNYVKFNLAD